LKLENKADLELMDLKGKIDEEMGCSEGGKGGSKGGE
jgi:hypothetical protein